MGDISREINLVSILVCSKDRRALLETVVKDIQAIETGYKHEIIVVEETDSGVPIPGTTYISHPAANRGVGFARNLACKHATGDILVFVDDDCRIEDKEWLDKLLKPLAANSSILGVQGGVTIPAGSNCVGWAESLLGFPGGGVKRILESDGQIQKTCYVSTLNCAYTREAVDMAGWFDDRLSSGSEDYLLAQLVSKQGTCLYVPDAVVIHAPRSKIGSIWNWFVTRGRADIELVRLKKLAKFNLSSLLKSSFGLKLAIMAGMAALLWGYSPLWSGISMTGCLGFYFLQQLNRNFRVWDRSSSPLAVLLVIPFVKVIMDLATDLGRIQRWLIRG